MEYKKKIKKGIIPVICGVALVGLSLSYAKSDSSDYQNAQPKKEKEQVVIGVTTTYASPINYTPQIIGTGEINPEKTWELNTDVSGKIIYLNEDFKVGNIIKKDETIAIIEDLKYKNELALAKSTMNKYKVALLEEQREMEQADSEWKMVNGKETPDSELVLRKPQYQMALSNYEQSVIAFELAEKDLKSTIIKAPYDLYVAEKNIETNVLLQSGSKIGTFYGIDKNEIEVPLSQMQWMYMGSDLKGSMVEITDVVTEQKWIGEINRVAKNLNNETRQRSVFVVIDQPLDKKAFAGTFVRVSFKGNPLENVWKLPQTAINKVKSNDINEVLIVNENMLIKKLDVKNVYRNKDFVFVRPIDKYLEGNVHIIKKPLVSYKENMAVEILKEGK